MEKIRLLIHLEKVSAGGTIHNFRQVLKYINRDEFDIYFATTRTDLYFDEFMKLLDPDKVLVYPYDAGIAGWDVQRNSFPAPVDNHPLYDFIAEHDIQIMYGERGGEPQFPFNKKIPGCKIVSTNIWGGHDPNEVVDYEILISRGVKNAWLPKASQYLKDRSDIIALMIDDPETDEDKREELGIAPDTFVVGRIGNVYVGDTENMYAYTQLEQEFGDKVACVWLNPSEDHKKMAQERGLKNIIFLPLCTDYIEKARIINTFDMFAHDRAESFGCAIAECIMHKKPVITTERPSKAPTLHSAHIDFFNDPSYLAGRGGAYYQKMKWLYEIGPEGRAKEGQKLFDYNYNKIAGKVLTKRVEQIFRNLVHDTDV